MEKKMWKRQELWEEKENAVCKEMKKRNENTIQRERERGSDWKKHTTIKQKFTKRALVHQVSGRAGQTISADNCGGLCAELELAEDADV